MIAYPIFCLRKKPYNIIYNSYQIKVQRYNNSHLETLDDHSFGGDYFMRLLQMEQRISFDYTCGNLQDLVLANCRWGVDSRAKIHDLPSYNKIKSEKRKIIRANKNTIWLEKISYPFKIQTKENLKGSVEGKQVDLIRVKGKYYIKRFFDEFTA
tara:strand:- start:121 stop:582 length:462 start_codon:yes stop_codon:yes gene_type:complete